MTEAEWLACADPQRMLPFLQATMSQRKLRLFACACLRRVWDLIDGEASRSAADAAERFADGELPPEERAAAFRLAAREASGWANCCGAVDAAISYAASAAAFVVAEDATRWQEAASAGDRGDDFLHMAEAQQEDDEWPGVWAVAAKDAGRAAACAASAWGGAFSADELEECTHDWERRSIAAGMARAARLGIHGVTTYESEEALREAVLGVENAAQVNLLHDISGNPFRPVTMEPPSIAVPPARAAYDERLLPSGELDPVRLAVLADALEESGAADEVVTHLRSPGPHIRGCWAVDLVLGLK